MSGYSIRVAVIIILTTVAIRGIVAIGYTAYVAQNSASHFTSSPRTPQG